MLWAYRSAIGFPGEDPVTDRVMLQIPFHPSKLRLPTPKRPKANSFIKTQPKFVIVELTIDEAFESFRITNGYDRPTCSTQTDSVVV